MIDLNNLGQYRENNRIEAKRALGGLPHSIWETYSAFANTLGGVILLGVEEEADKSLRAVGLPEPKLLAEEFWRQVNDPSRTSVNVLSADDVAVEETDGGRIVVIDVPRAERTCRPVYVDGDTRNTYRRSGEGDCRCTREEYEAMVRDASVRTQDMLVVEGADLGVFDGESVRAYRRRLHVRRPGQAWEELDDAAFLRRVGATGDGADGGEHPTAAGLLLFGGERDIRRLYPHYALEYREERGDGSRRMRLASSDGDWSGNLLDFYFRVYGRLRQGLGAAPGLRGCSRADAAPVYRAVREALANCLVNADYYAGGGVAVVRRRDGLTLSNPGSFRIGLAEARSGGLSDPRNGAVSELFRLLGVGRGAGSGIAGIFRVWRERGWAEPAIAQPTGPERTTLSLRLAPPETYPGANAGERDTAATEAVKRQMLIDYLTDHAGATLAELADYVDLRPSLVQEYLAQLTLERIVFAEGESRDRTYRLKN